MGLNNPNMGSEKLPPHGHPRPSGLADALFTQTQQRVLGILFATPDRVFHRAEIIRMAGGGTGAIHRELTRLTQSGLITVSEVGNQKHYQANRDSPVFEELRGLILKTVGLVMPLQQALVPFAGKIAAAFVYGSVARRTDTAHSDIDLLVLSDDLTYGELFEGLQVAEETLQRKVNPTLMTPAEWQRKVEQANPFVMRVVEQPTLSVMGETSEMGMLGVTDADDDGHGR